MLSYVTEEQLMREYERFKKRLPQMARSSADAELLHQRELEEKGNLKYAPSKGEVLTCSRQEVVKIQRLNGKIVEVVVDSLMRNRRLTWDALKEEEGYIKELTRREGRYGREIMDLSVDWEVHFLSMVADALELKANAFAIHGGRDCVSVEDMRESIMVVERGLAGILQDLVDRHSGHMDSTGLAGLGVNESTAETPLAGPGR
jgi:hypothetical protein